MYTKIPFSNRQIQNNTFSTFYSPTAPGLKRTKQSKSLFYFVFSYLLLYPFLKKIYKPHYEICVAQIDTEI